MNVWRDVLYSDGFVVFGAICIIAVVTVALWAWLT